MAQAVREISVQKEMGAGIYIDSCKTIRTAPVCEDYEDTASVWGLEVSFSNGKTMYIPDICTKQSDIHRLAARLNGADLCPFSLCEVVEDYLVELYGVSV